MATNEKQRQSLAHTSTPRNASKTLHEMSPVAATSPFLSSQATRDIYCESLSLGSLTPLEEAILANIKTVLPSPTLSEDEALAPVHEQQLAIPYFTLPNPSKLPPWPASTYHDSQHDEDIISEYGSNDTWERDNSGSSPRLVSRSVSLGSGQSRRPSIESWESDFSPRNALSLEEELGEFDWSGFPLPHKEERVEDGKDVADMSADKSNSISKSNSKDIYITGDEHNEGNRFDGVPMPLLWSQSSYDTTDNEESSDFLNGSPDPLLDHTVETGRPQDVSTEWNDFLSTLPDDQKEIAQYSHNNMTENSELLPLGRPQSRHGGFKLVNAALIRPNSRHGSFDGVDHTPDFTSRFPAVNTFPGLHHALEHVTTLTEDNTNAQAQTTVGGEHSSIAGEEIHNPQLDDYLNEAQGSTPESQPEFDSYFNGFDSCLSTGIKSVFEDDSGSDYSDWSDPGANDIDVIPTQSEPKPQEILADERKKIREYIKWKEGQKASASPGEDSTEESEASCKTKNHEPGRPLSPEQVPADNFDFFTQSPKPELPPHLQDPENPKLYWDRDNLDLNVRNDMGRIPDGGWAEPPEDPSTDYDQLRNNYQLNGVQENGYNHLSYLNAEIEGAYIELENASVSLRSIQEEGHKELGRLKSEFLKVREDLTEADARLLTFIEKREIELDRGRESGIGIAKRKILLDLDRDRRGFLQRAPCMENSSAFGPNGKITIPSLEYAMFDPGDFQPTPKIVQTLEGVRWEIKETKKELATVTQKLSISEQDVEFLNCELDKLEKERNDNAKVANERTRAANEFQDKLFEEKERTAKLSADLDVEMTRVQVLQTQQIELQATLEKSTIEHEKLLSKVQGVESLGEPAPNPTSLTNQDIDMLKEALVLADNAAESAEIDLVLRDERQGELMQKLAKNSMEEEHDQMLYTKMASPAGEELRWYKAKVRGLERDLIYAHNQLKNCESRLAGNRAEIESIKMESRAKIESLKLKNQEADGERTTLIVDKTPITPAPFQIDDQTFNASIEGRILSRELADKDKRIQELERQSDELCNVAKIKQIDLQLALARIKTLEGDILWLSDNRPNFSMGQPTLPTQLEPLRSDAKAGQTTLPIFSADDGIDYAGVERDPVKREEKYRKRRIAEALRLERRFAVEMLKVKEGEEKLRKLGFKVEDDEGDDYPARLFERSKPWEPESDPILWSSLPKEDHCLREAQGIALEAV
jgi:hypothetical protein